MPALRSFRCSRPTAAPARVAAARQRRNPVAAAASSSPPDLSDWRTFRAALVAAEASAGVTPLPAVGCRVARDARWAHALAAPEKGALLVAARADLGPLFTQAVVLIVDHDPLAGSAGLVLNVPSRGLVGDVGLDADLAGAFAASTLYCGGPVAQTSLHLLHGEPGLAGSHEVLPGVYAGGLPAANALAGAGGAPPSAFRLLSGYAGWEAGQLEAEARRGAWHIVAASPAAVRDVVQGRARGGGGGASEKGAAWRGVLALAGLPPPPPVAPPPRSSRPRSPSGRRYD